MVDYIKLRKGLNIPIKGYPQPVTKKSIVSGMVALKPTDFRGLIPKLLVREGDTVKAGSPVFADKAHPEVVFTSPVSGTIQDVVRGEKRKLLEIRINADSTTEYVKFDFAKVESLSKEEITAALLQSGLWPCIKQRPYGIIPNPLVAPKSIYISCFSSAPLAPDYDYCLREDFDYIQAAINALSKLTSGGVNVSLSAKSHASTPFHKLNNVKFHIIDGPHPAGNVGVQIHHICPINKGDIVWTIDLHHVAAIGKLFLKNVYDMSRTVAVTGPRVDSPCYVKGICGMPMKSFTEFALKDDRIDLHKDCGIRYISGDVLTGTNVGEEGYLGFFDNQVTLITEGNYHEAFGWAKPFRFGKFSFSSTYMTNLLAGKNYDMDSNLNGGERAFVVTGKYEKVLPMDIYPVYLLKAILAGDIDKMEQLGIYEVIEEDLALCEYICPSKIEVQSIISKGIDLMISEMS